MFCTMTFFSAGCKELRIKKIMSNSHTARAACFQSSSGVEKDPSGRYAGLKQVCLLSSSLFLSTIIKLSAAECLFVTLSPMGRGLPMPPPTPGNIGILRRACDCLLEGLRQPDSHVVWIMCLCCAVAELLNDFHLGPLSKQ